MAHQEHFFFACHYGGIDACILSCHPVCFTVVVQTCACRWVSGITSGRTTVCRQSNSRPRKAYKGESFGLFQAFQNSRRCQNSSTSTCGTESKRMVFCSGVSCSKSLTVQVFIVACVSTKKSQYVHRKKSTKIFHWRHQGYTKKKWEPRIKKEQKIKRNTKRGETDNQRDNHKEVFVFKDLDRTGFRVARRPSNSA